MKTSKQNVAAIIGAAGLCFYPLLNVAQDSPEQTGKELFEQTCSACHSLALPRSQRLDRSNWEWVLDDMVNQFGCNWINEEQQRKIVDYLVENHGP